MNTVTVSMPVPDVAVGSNASPLIVICEPGSTCEPGAGFTNTMRIAEAGVQPAAWSSGAAAVPIAVAAPVTTSAQARVRHAIRRGENEIDTAGTSRTSVAP